MGTAVLSPQDCLPGSDNRCKGHLSEALASSDGVFRTRSGIFRGSSSRDLTTTSSDSCKTTSVSGKLGWISRSTPLRAQDHVAIPSSKDDETSKFKGKKHGESKDLKAATKPTCDMPVVTILQRPKDKEAADDLIVKFLLKVDEEAARDREIDIKLKASEMRVCRAVRNHGSHQSSGEKLRLQYGLQRKYVVETKLPKSNSKKDGCTLTTDSTVLDSKSSAPKIVNNTRNFMSEAHDHAETTQGFHGPATENHHEFDNSEHLKGLSQLAGVKAMPEHKHHIKKSHLVEIRRFKQSEQTISESIVPGGLSTLKRATTDPLIVHQLSSRHRSDVVNIPVSSVKSHNRFPKIISMSCPERWAGPSYHSSPAPSSLPLPKFFVQAPKMLSSRSSGEVCLRSIAQGPESCAPSPEPSPMQGAALDVVFATKNLRRMLKLDAC